MFVISSATFNHFINCQVCIWKMVVVMLLLNHVLIEIVLFACWS